MNRVNLVRARCCPFANLSVILSVVSPLILTIPFSLLCSVIAIVRIQNAHGELVGLKRAWFSFGLTSFFLLLSSSGFHGWLPGQKQLEFRRLSNYWTGSPLLLDRQIASSESIDFFGKGKMKCAYLLMDSPFLTDSIYLDIRHDHDVGERKHKWSEWGDFQSESIPSIVKNAFVDTNSIGDLFLDSLENGKGHYRYRIRERNGHSDHGSTPAEIECCLLDTANKRLLIARECY